MSALFLELAIIALFLSSSPPPHVQIENDLLNGGPCPTKAMLQNTFVTTKYSTPAQVVTLVMTFPKLSFEPL